MTEYQSCIVHVVRNTLRHVAGKDKKAFTTDLKRIYHAPDEEQGRARMMAVSQVWGKKNPGCMRRWEDNRDVISPMFEFSQAVRKVIYTTNTIESLNSGYRRLPNMCEQSFLTAAVQNMKRLARTFFIRLSPLYIALIQTATLRFPWKAAVC